MKKKCPISQEKPFKASFALVFDAEPDSLEKEKLTGRCGKKVMRKTTVSSINENTKKGFG